MEVIALVVSLAVLILCVVMIIKFFELCGDVKRIADKLVPPEELPIRTSGQFAVNPRPTRSSGPVVFPASANALRVIAKVNGAECIIDFKPGHLTEKAVDGVNILCVDCDASEYQPSDGRQFAYLLVGKGFSGELEDLIKKIGNPTVVFSCAMAPGKEADLTRKAKQLGLKTHSLQEGPARF